MVLVNGLWLPDLALRWLAHQLTRAGFDAHSFSYPSVNANLQANAGRLQDFLSRLPGGVVHLVGYSLGGLVVRALFHYYPEQRPGRVLLLGSPQRGSGSARALVRWRWGRYLLGQSADILATGISRSWTCPERDIGVIAGTRPFGLGQLVNRSPQPNDGTVAVAETALPEAKDRLLLPVTHVGMLLAPGVARQIAHFLNTGRFDR